MTPIKIEYRYDSGDIDEVFRMARSRAWKKARSRVLLLIPLVFICLGLLLWRNPFSPVIFLLFGICLGAMAIVWSAWLQARRQTQGIWKAYPVLQYKFTAEIDSECVKTTCDIASNMRRWECFIGYHESANLFHLQEGQRALWIPKRAFAGEAEISQMRELLRSKLSCTTA